jgi:hypothetical protein
MLTPIPCTSKLRTILGFPLLPWMVFKKKFKKVDGFHKGYHQAWYPSDFSLRTCLKVWPTFTPILSTTQHLYLPITLGHFLQCFTSAKNGGYEIEAKLME